MGVSAVLLKVCVYEQGMWVIGMKYFWEVDTSLLIISNNYSFSFNLYETNGQFGVSQLFF